MSTTASDAAKSAPRPALPRRRKPRELPPGGLACRDCGHLVRQPDPDRTTALLSYGVATPGGVRETRHETYLTTCDRCELRRDMAHELIQRHASLRQALGSIAYGVGLVAAALAALDAVGVPEGAAARLAATERDLRQLVNALARVGGAAYWSSQLAPTLWADPDKAHPTRWAHLSDELAQRLRDDYARLLRAHTEQPALMPPPSGADRAGCLMCGVGALLTRPSLAADVWGPLRAVQPGTLGAARVVRQRPVYGHICPPCTRAAEMEGAVGMSAVERALFAHLGRVPVGAVELRGLRAWAALPPATPPSAEPWAHESGLAAELKRARLPLARLNGPRRRAVTVERTPRPGGGR